MVTGGTDDPVEPPKIVPGPPPVEESSRASSFNMQKATFFLVGFVMALYGAALLFAEFACFLWLIDKCSPESTGKINEGFASLLASALAFAAGQSGATIRKS